MHSGLNKYQLLTIFIWIDSHTCHQAGLNCTLLGSLCKQVTEVSAFDILALHVGFILL